MAPPSRSEIAPKAHSRYLALFMVALGIGRAIGDVLGPVLFTWKGVPAPAFASAIGAVAGLFVVLVVFRGEDS